MIIYESKKPYNDKLFGSSDPFMFALGLAFLIVMLVYWSGAFIYKKIRLCLFIGVGHSSIKRLDREA